MNNAEYARSQGYKVGDILKGTEYYWNGKSSTAVIRINYIGSAVVIAKVFEINGETRNFDERLFDLSRRDWETVEPISLSELIQGN